MQKQFNFTDVLSYGWSTMKANLGFFIGLVFIFLFITYLPTVAIEILKRADVSIELKRISIISIQILSQIIQLIIGIGMMKIALSFCDEQKPPFSRLFDIYGCFWRYIGTMLLYSLIVIGGIVLLVVPGIIWSVKFNLCGYFVIDKGLGPIQALKASSRATMGVKWDLFGFGIICGLINLAGLLCLIIGIFATYPTIIVAYALVYRQLAAQTPELAEFTADPFAPQTITEEPANTNWQNM